MVRTPILVGFKEIAEIGYLTAGMRYSETSGGGTPVQRGPHLRYGFRGRRGLFLRPPHVRDFVKKGTFLYPGKKYGGQNPLTIHEIYAALTPIDSRSDWASEFDAAKHAGDYYILS